MASSADVKTTSPVNDLMTSGTLHGVNFLEWKERTMATLRLQGLETYVLHQHRPSSGNDPDWYTKSTLAASLIALLVDPKMIARVSASDKANAHLLMRRLESMCTHFRFLDLSAELRNQIYDLTLAGCDRYALNKTRTAENSGYPSITKVSKQIRAEILPIFYSTAKFRFYFGSDGSNGIAMARWWFVKTAKDNIKLAQSVSVMVPINQLRYRNREKMSEFIFSCTEREGLQIQYPACLTHASKVKVDAHKRSAQEASKLYGNSSASSIMFFALFTNEAMWKRSNLDTN